MISSATGSWLGGGGGGKVSNDPRKYNANTKKQGYLQSAMDQHGFVQEDAPKK